ncbi:MAG TPA: class I SAM-dependent methyltransferase [Ktedonobacteraceae bacterium]|jgi:ubiquinone/menaquinone biosynthesis C-methylase UbiE
MQNEDGTLLEKQMAGKALEQLQLLKRLFPDLYCCVDLARFRAYHELLPDNPCAAQQTDFEDEQQGGRGLSYRNAQRNPLVRAAGIKQLFTLASPNERLPELSPRYRLLDILGGDGTLTRALAQMLPVASLPTILTSDIAQGMIEAAQAYGLAALRQAAQSLVLKDNCFDSAIIAYGAHHIPPAQRLQAVQEAFRVLKPGGKLIFHDFEEQSPVATWFASVVDPYSLTGHKYGHFTRAEITNYLLEAGFTNVRVQHLYDPFVLAGESPEQLEIVLGEYLFHMYGLTQLLDLHERQSVYRAIYNLAYQCFQYDYALMELSESFGKSEISCFQQGVLWFVEMPRVALVGIGSKPAETAENTEPCRRF